MHVNNNSKVYKTVDSAQWLDSPLEGLDAMQSARPNNEPSHECTETSFGKVQAVCGKQMTCL